MLAYPEPTKKVGSAYSEPNERGHRQQNPDYLVGSEYNC